MVWCFDDNVVISLRAAIHSQDTQNTQMYKDIIFLPLICLMSPHLMEQELGRKGTTEDKTVGWHYWLNVREFD